jgi:methyl-accepting chemotaxis protein
VSTVSTTAFIRPEATPSRTPHHRYGLSVTRRLGILVSACALLICLMAGFAWMQLNRVSTLAVGLGQNALPSVQRALETRLHVTEYRAAELRVLSEPNNRPAVLKDLERSRALIEDDQPALRALLVSTDQSAAFDTFVATWKLYLANSVQAVDLAQKSQWDDAWTLLTGESQRQQEAMHKALSELSRLKAHAADASVSDVIAARQTAWVVMASCAGVGLLVAIVLAVLLARSIARPLQQALDVAAAVAEGDLSRPVTPGGPREVGILLRRLQQMQQSLHTLVGSVRESSNRISSTSNLAADGNRDLSARTEQQAGNVQEIVSTMEQLSAAVRHNADAAHEASKMVTSAADVATRGGKAVQRVVMTMNEINEASQRIARIVDLTTDIAFQTDILALNAAVEAARAGGQGRSFAVVAAEVRNLSKRSSAAAREIATLIASSVEKVNTGAVEVRDAGRTMEEIVAQVSRVSEFVRTIAASTEEQSGGITAVNDAVTALHELTRQNATLVGQNRNTSTILQGQSAHLAEMVAVFQLGDAPPSAI